MPTFILFPQLLYILGKSWHKKELRELTLAFDEHGTFEVKVNNGVLLVDATGPFNKELVTKYRRALERCYSELKNTRWHQIIILRQLSLFTPEAADELTKSLKYRKQLQLDRCAVVIKSEIKNIVKDQMSRCYNKAMVTHEYFDRIEDAQEWVTKA